MRYVRSGRGGWSVLMVLVVLLATGVSWGQWQIQPITAVPSAGATGTVFYGPPAMTFDGQDRPHVAYAVTRGSSVCHAFASAPGASGTWTMPNLPAIPNAYIVMPGVIHLGAAGGKVYLSAGSNPSSGTRIASAVFDGASWQVSAPADLTTYYGVVLGMAVDKTGHMNWLANITYSGGGIYVGGYSLLRLGDDGHVTPASGPSGIAPSQALYSYGRDLLQADGELIFDNDGNMHTVQFNDHGSTGILSYVKGPASGPFTVDTNVDPTWMVKTGRPGLAVDASGNPHIVYTTLWPSYRVYHLTRNGTGWRRETIDTAGKRTGCVGTFPDILIDHGGVMHVIYADGLHGVVKHAKLVSGQWQIETIDSIGTQADHSIQVGALAAAIDSTGGIAVVYWSGQAGMLKYAYLAP